MKRVLWCISVFFIGSLLRAAPINETTPDPIFKNDSLFKSAYTFKKSYSIIYLNSEILKTSKEVSEMLLADPGGVSAGLQLWLKADAGVSSDINTDSGVWSDQSGQNNHANNSGTNLSSNGSGTPSITYNTTSNLINYNPNLAFNFEQLKVGLDINPLAIGDMDIYVVVDGNNAILGNENGGVDRSIAPNRVSNGVDIQDYFFGSGDSRYNDQLKIIHYSFGATSNASATSFINVNSKLIKTFTEQNSNGGYTDLYIGNAGSVGSFSGQIAEIIIYDNNLTGDSKSKVDTYLSLKYGISLDNPTTTDYVASDGTVVFDAFPYNPLECADSDGDGLGDNEDPDDNNDGCADTDLCISELLTPNEPGLESVWLIQNITQYSSAYVRVFDRHKNLVFDQQGYKNNWDGKYQKSKKPLPAGPYYYIVQLNDGSAPRSGWLYITY